MKKSKRLVVLACVLCIIGLAGAMVSANYDLSWHVIGGGGGPMSSANYCIDGTVGQIIGVSESANYRVEAGYWSGIAVVPSEPSAVFTIELVSGYNLISMPVNDPAVTTALSLMNKIGVNCQEALKWNATKQSWESFNRLMPPVAAFDIKPGGGYLVRMDSSASIEFCDSGWPSPFTMSLVANYNLIGLPVNDTSVTNASALLTKIGASAQEVLRWNKNTQSWVSFNPAMPPAAAFDIEGGEGYLVRLTAASSVTFTGNPWQN